MTAIENSVFKLLLHAPYSPDLAPNDFYLFPKMNQEYANLLMTHTCTAERPRTSFNTIVCASSVVTVLFECFAGQN